MLFYGDQGNGKRSKEHILKCTFNAVNCHKSLHNWYQIEAYALKYMNYAKYLHMRYYNVD